MKKSVVMRRWLRWERYLDRCIALNAEGPVGSGGERAYNAWATVASPNRHNTRRGKWRKTRSST